MYTDRQIGRKALVALFALVTAACGGGGSTDGAPAEVVADEDQAVAAAQSDEASGVAGSEIDPCALLTDGEVSAAWGEGVSTKFGPHKPADLNGWVECRWDIGGGDLPDQIYVRTDGENGVGSHEALRPGSDFAPADAELVSGIGDDAYISEAPSPVIYVLVDDVAIQIQACCAGDMHDHGMKVLPDLAKIAAARV